MDETVWLERAGLWRRAAALMLDGLCVAVPSAVVGAILFALTGGFLQWRDPGLKFQSCTSLSSIPANLEPPPPPDSNGAQACESYSVAGLIGRWLDVSRTTRTAHGVTSVGRTYLLSRSAPVVGHDLSWVSWIGLLGLLVAAEWRRGTTPGKRLLRLRVVSSRTLDPAQRPLPLKLIAIRYGIAIGMILIPFASGLIIAELTGQGWPIILAFLVMSGWMLWNTARIVRRKPTLYDHIATIDIIRDPSQTHSAAR